MIIEADPFGWKAADEDRRQWRAAAKSDFLPGIDPADLRPGSIVTVSPNLSVPDRSYTNTVWRVKALNQCQVVLEATDGSRAWLDNKPIMLMAHEHHFYAADDLLKALES